MKQTLLLSGLLAVGLFASSCTSASNALNPFYEPPSEVALRGDLDDHALAGDRDKVDTARQALEASATYRRANAPQPVNPVIQPAVVRLLWIPDHLNDKGDLVPAHYYYLKVLRDRWAVQDAFELEGQLGPTVGAGNVPYQKGGEVYK